MRAIGQLDREVQVIHTTQCRRSDEAARLLRASLCTAPATGQFQAQPGGISSSHPAFGPPLGTPSAIGGPQGRPPVGPVGKFAPNEMSIDPPPQQGSYGNPA